MLINQSPHFIRIALFFSQSPTIPDSHPGYHVTFSLPFLMTLTELGVL